MTTREKMWEKGEKLYNAFCNKFPSIPLTTPRTQTLELFVLLSDCKESNLLIREMMKEYLSNIDDIELLVERGRLYYTSKIKRRL